MSLNEKDELKCSFCGKIFKYKSSLKKHIETAKFCLNIQNKTEPTTENKKFICEYCNCEFKAKRNLQSHLLICKEKDKLKVRKEYDKKLEDLKNEYLDIINNQKIIIAELNGRIKIYEHDHNVISDIAKQTKITNTNNNTNNIINNMAVYDIDSIKDRLINSNITKTIDTNTIYQFRRHYVRENKNNVCPTLTANMGTGGHNVPLIRDQIGIRKLTPRECFKLQGFPESFILPNISDSSLYKLAGNAVTVDVVYSIAKNIIKVLEEIE